MILSDDLKNEILNIFPLNQNVHLLLHDIRDVEMLY